MAALVIVTYLLGASISGKCDTTENRQWMMITVKDIHVFVMLCTTHVTLVFCIPLVYNVEVVTYEYDLVDKINTFILFNYI